MSHAHAFFLANIILLRAREVNIENKR